MKRLARRALPLALLLWAALPCPSQTPQLPELDPAAWKSYSSAPGGFAAVFPGTPVEETMPAPPPAQNLLMHATTVRTAAEYSVAYADYPFPVEGTDGAQTFLANVRDAGVKGMNSRLVEDKEEAFAGHPGRLYKVEFGGGYYLTCRSLVVGSRLYMVMTTTYGEKKAPPEVVRIYEAAAKRFLGSFRLGADGEGKSELPPEGEVTRMRRQLDAAGELVLGICSADKPCDPIKGKVVNGRSVKGDVVLPKAVSKPQPAYPPIARAARASGTVVVQVIVDESGKVIAAQALSGHPLLHVAAVGAARGWEFTPTLLDGRPVKVIGTITFNFNLQ